MAFTMLSIPGMSAFAESLPTGDSFEVPQNLTVELKEWEDGRPYFALKWTNPQSIWELGQYGVEYGEWGAEYQVDMKVGEGQWRYDMGESLFGNALSFDGELDEPGNYITDDVICDPMDLGVEGTADIKANVYHLRVRYAYSANQGGDIEHYIYSPFSNTASIGTGEFYKEASGTDNFNPNVNASETTSVNPDANASKKAVNSRPIPADVRAKLPDGFPDIPIAADAEFDPYFGAILPSGDDYILIAYKSKQTLEALYYSYIDFLKDAKDFFTHKQDDGKLYTINGVKDGWGIGVAVSLSMGNQVSIIVEIPEN